MIKRVSISTQKPPQWILDEVKEKWGVTWESGVIFTYGDLITNCEGSMSEDLIAHETHHTTQQESFGGPDKWWREYLDNPEFRLDQELECYRKQYKWVLNNIPSKQIQFQSLMHYARSISGKMYGDMITLDQAIKLIR